MKGWTLSVACEETATASDEEKWSSSKWSISAKRGGVLDMEGVCFLVLEDCLLEAWSAEGKTDDAESKERKAEALQHDAMKRATEEREGRQKTERSKKMAMRSTNKRSEDCNANRRMRRAI